MFLRKNIKYVKKLGYAINCLVEHKLIEKKKAHKKAFYN